MRKPINAITRFPVDLPETISSLSVVINETKSSKTLKKQIVNNETKIVYCDNKDVSIHVLQHMFVGANLYPRNKKTNLSIDLFESVCSQEQYR